MKQYKLSLEEQAATGFTDKFVLTHADLTESTTNTAQTIALYSAAVGEIVRSAGHILITPFEDASDNTLSTTTIIVGDDGDTNRFLVSTELNANGSYVSYSQTANSVDSLPYAYSTANTIDVVVGSPGTSLALEDVDTGEVHIYLGISSLD